MGAETPKQFLELDGVPILIFTLRRLAAVPADYPLSDVATRAPKKWIPFPLASRGSKCLAGPSSVVRG